MRAVLDPNVLIAALLSPGGAPARLVAAWLAGEFELVVSDELLDELRRALAYPKLRKRVSPEEAAAFSRLLSTGGIVASHPGAGTHRSEDPGDDYLLALAEVEQAVLVSGDRHLLVLAPKLPVMTAAEFLEALRGRGLLG